MGMTDITTHTPQGLTQIEKQIYDLIVITRAQHHACTAGHIALQLDVAKSWIVTNCERMRERGLVDWTPFPGSLHVVERTSTWAELPPSQSTAIVDEQYDIRTQVQPIEDDEIPTDPIERARYYGRQGAAKAAANRQALRDVQHATNVL